MAGFSTNIEADTLENENFRKVMYTAPHLQVVLMTLLPGEEIGLETHDHGDQFFRVEAGTGEALIGGERHSLSDGVAFVIPEGVEHNVINTSTSEKLRVYTIYTPPQHPEGTIHRTKAEADAAEDH
ncbi:MAG: cupin domain-containing protein [Thermomicrobiales bacterium]